MGLERMRLSWAAATDAGVRRDVNEDSYCARPDLGLFVVADGMGGHAAGEIASRLAVDVIEAHVHAAQERERARPSAGAADTDAGRRNAATLMADAFRAANRRIADEVSRESAHRGMATTASAVLLDHRGASVVAHVGDSRVYLMRRGELRRLTQDHSWVEEQVRAGVLDPHAARQHPWRSVVTRALNGGDDPSVDVSPVSLEAGDRLILCSDGLPVVVADDRIAGIVSAPGSLDGMCRRLVGAANDEGGPDNITILAVEVHAA